MPYYVVVVVVVSKHIHNLLLSFVVFYFFLIMVTMDAMQEAQFGAVFLFVFTFDPIVLTVVVICCFLLLSPWTQCRKYNLVPFFVCFHI